MGPGIVRLLDVNEVEALAAASQPADERVNVSFTVQRVLALAEAVMHPLAGPALLYRVLATRNPGSSGKCPAGRNPCRPAAADGRKPLSRSVVREESASAMPVFPPSRSPQISSVQELGDRFDRVGLPAPAQQGEDRIGWSAAVGRLSWSAGWPVRIEGTAIAVYEASVAVFRYQGRGALQAGEVGKHSG